MERLPFAEKYASRNPVSRFLVSRFIDALSRLVRRVKPRRIFEVGCGEGYLALALARQGYHVHGVDVREDALEFARRQAREEGLEEKLTFSSGNIYELLPLNFSADLLICCEVLEHLDFPEKGLERLAALPVSRAIFSVPREPVWRCLNMCRFRYLSDFGNTPGHLNHWSRNSFETFLRTRYAVLETTTPLPWTMVLCGKKEMGDKQENGSSIS